MGQIKILLFLLVCSTLFSQTYTDPAEWLHDYDLRLYDYYNEQLHVPEYEVEKQKTLTGNWHGSRLWLEKHGVTIDLSYVTDMVANPIGGEAKGFAYCGSLGGSLALDFERACGWTGFSFFSSVVWRTGTSLTRNKIGNQFSVQQAFGSQTIKLNELFLQQMGWENAIIAKAGRLDAGNDFLASPLYAEFVNNAFDGNPVAVFPNFPTFTAYPNATWGAFLAITPIPQLRAKFGIYNANNHIFLNKYHGANFTFESTNGVILITEWSAILNQALGDRGMPGNYKVGFLYQTGTATEFKNGIVHGNYCYYFLFDQVIFRPEHHQKEQGLTAFISLLFAPSNRNTFPFFTTSGLVYKGLVPQRPHDTTNLGFAYGGYSSDLSDREVFNKNNGLLGPFGNQPQDFEAVIELNHWFQINDWCTFTPDIQYIINPKGYGTIQNAFVVGAQIGFIL